jgi:hypothetical protein
VRGAAQRRSSITDKLGARLFAGLAQPVVAQRHSMAKIGVLQMSKMGGDSARFNKIKSRRNVHRARMRALRAEIAARKIVPGSVLEKLKA